MTLQKNTRSVLAAAATISVLLVVQKSASATDDTTALLQQMFNNNQYPDLLPKLNAALASTKSTADVGNHYDLLVLKGETLLRTKSYESARDVFRAASLLKIDKKKTTIAHATAELIKQSDAGKYEPDDPTDGSKPTTQHPAAIDIVDTDSRKQAFTALYADMMTRAKPDIDQCENATSLAPIITAAGEVSDARPIEVAATDDDKQVTEALTKLADQAKTLMTDALKKLDAKVSAASKSSSAAAKRTKVTKYGTITGGSSRGLNGNYISDLTSVVPQARQIAGVAVKMEPIFADIGDLKSVETAADKTANDANAILVKNHHLPVD